MRRWRFWQAVPLPVLIIGFLEQAAFVVLFLFLTQRYLADDLGLGAAFVGYVITVFGITKLASQAAAGWLGDRIGYRASLLLATAYGGGPRRRRRWKGRPPARLAGTRASSSGGTLARSSSTMG